MARTHAKAEFTVPIKASRPRFELSTAFANVDVEKISSKANVEIEVGTFDGDGCVRAESAVAKKGSSCVSRFRLARSDSNSCGRVVETSLSLAATRNKLGEKGKAPKFRPMNFAAFQQSADDITVTTITCVQICIWGIASCAVPRPLATSCAAAG